MLYTKDYVSLWCRINDRLTIKKEKMKELNEDDLLKMDTLHGEALDAHLMEMKELYIKSDEKDAIRKHLDGELDTIENRIDSLDKRITIREQMSEIIDLIPISYIAKNYFGKSRAWLYQRINGYKVRGRVYSLNEKEVETFNRALKDISHKIGSLSVSSLIVIRLSNESILFSIVSNSPSRCFLIASFSSDFI